MRRERNESERFVGLGANGSTLPVGRASEEKRGKIRLFSHPGATLDAMTDPQAEAPGAPRAGAHAVMAAPAGDPPWRAPPDERWWPAVAARILELAGLPRSGAADATVRTADHLTRA